jgi:ribosomal protein S12 methylthiotransferase accessory factor
MRLERRYLNERIELLDGVYGSETHAELEELGRLYNPTTGPVTSVTLQRPDLLELSMISASCRHAPIGSLLRDLSTRADIPDALPIPASGKGARLPRPLLGALGEMAERLLAVLHFAAVSDRLVTATYEQLEQAGLSALGPDELPLFAPEQYAQRSFEYVPFEPETRLRWVEGARLRSGEPILVPAQLVLMYSQTVTREARIGYPTSGGLAFHRDRRRAILHGLYEVIERDAVNLRWMCRLPPPRVDVDIADVLSSEWKLFPPRLETPAVGPIAVYLNTVDVPIPVFTAIAFVRSRSDRTLLSGGGAWSTRERALAQTVFELGQAQTALRAFRPGSPKHVGPDTDPAQMTDFFDVALYYGYPQNHARLSWYQDRGDSIAWEDTPGQRFRDDAEEFEWMFELLESAGLDPVVFELDGACPPGTHLTKVFVPELTQAFIPSHPYLGHPRFAEVPVHLGLSNHPLEHTELTADPLPFS